MKDLARNFIAPRFIRSILCVSEVEAPPVVVVIKLKLLNGLDKAVLALD